MIQKEFIRSELRYRYPNLEEHICAPQQSVARPLLFERGERLFGARIIICDAAELNAMRGGSQTEPLFLCIGRPNQNAMESFDLCVLPEHEQKGAILNFVQRLFDRLDDWTQSLRQAAETGVEIEGLLTRASEMLQNPIALLDERGHIVAQSEQTETDFIQLLFNQTPASFDGDDYASVQKLGEESAPNALYARYRNNETSYTLICAAGDRPLYASDEIVFESLSGYLRLMLSQRTMHIGPNRAKRENEAIVRLLRELLSQDQPGQATLEQLTQLGWSEASEYAVLAIEPEDGNLRASRADAICDDFERALEGSCVFTASSVIVAIVCTDETKENERVDRLRTIAGSQSLRIGICEPMGGFSFLSQRLDLAKRALNRTANSGGVSSFFDAIEAEIVSGSFSDMPKELICMRAVRNIARFDVQHKTCYLDTMEQYVKHHFNAVKTAGALFIHRSTFLYRLERIKTQFGLDLDDESLSILHLMLSISIARQLHP